MNKLLTSALLFSVVFICSCSRSEKSTAGVMWSVDNLESIGGHKTTVLGSPTVIETDKGRAVRFDGVKDGLIVDELPIAGAGEFTIEIIFRPDPDGPKEQRFLHLQEDGSEYRILIETRLTDSRQWYLDTYIKSSKGDKTLYDRIETHRLGQWYNATLIFDGQEMRHYVNAVKEISKKLDFAVFDQGKTSIGVRMNRVHWFKGAVREVRFTPHVLEPRQFLAP